MNKITSVESMKAVVRKEMVSLKTYPYSDPAPVPEFGRLYPYAGAYPAEAE